MAGATDTARLTPDAQLRQALDRTWLAASPAIEELLGYAPTELVGRPALELVHPDERAAVERALRAALRVSDSCVLQLRAVRRDGSLLDADVRYDTLRDPDGGVLEYRVTLRDASDRREMERLEAQWELLFRATSRGIAVTDPFTLVLEAVNPAFAAMHGGAVEDFLGRPVSIVLTEGAEANLRARALRLEEPDLVAYESEHVRMDGTVFPCAIELMQTRYGPDQRLHWLSWVDDLTERRRAERDAARRADELARSNADLDRFAGVVAHDLQSPLRVIAGCARILERRAGDALPPEQRELVEHIVRGVHRMSALLDGIREYSRVRGGDEGRRERVALADVVREALASLEADLEAAGAAVTVGELPAVEADRVQLARLFLNLIGNAVKFRAEAAPAIAVSARSLGPVWEVTVADNGIGIEPELAEHVFQFGNRLHGEDRFPGTGIGLAVCKAVVERHGGRIWVEPRAGGGSAFRFTIPASGS